MVQTMGYTQQPEDQTRLCQKIFKNKSPAQFCKN